MNIGAFLNQGDYEKINKISNIDLVAVEEMIIKLNYYDMLIIKSDTDNLSNILEAMKHKGNKIILWGNDISPNKLRDYFTKGLIYDYIDRESYYNLIGIVAKVEEEINSDVVSIGDASQELFISINKLNYITYDRISRKSIINCGDKNITITKKLSDLEFYLSKFGSFVKADRSTIVNMKLIESINYKNESISFVGGDMISLSKNKLKELSEYVALAN